MNTPAVPKPNVPAKYPVLMTKDPDLKVDMPGSKVDRGPDKGKDSQRNGVGNKGVIDKKETRTSLFKKCSVAAAGLLLLSYTRSVCLSRAREKGVKAGGPVAAMTLPLEIIPRRKNSSFRKLRRFLLHGLTEDVEFATMTASHDEWDAMLAALDSGEPVIWATVLRGRRWTGDVKEVESDGFIENSPECNYETLYKYRLLSGLMPPFDGVHFKVSCCGDQGVDGKCVLSCDCFDLESLETAYWQEDEPINDDMFADYAFWGPEDAAAKTYKCIAVDMFPLEQCCPPGSVDSMDSLCTLLSYVDTTDITLKEPSTCQDIKRACFELGIFDDLPLCNHVLTCCGASTEGLDFNQCIGQLIPKKDDCLAIYGRLRRAFNCGEGTAAGTRQLETKFHQDQREGHRDRQLETESHHEQQEHGRLLSGKTCRRHYNRRALSETDLVSDMKLRGDESCLEAPYKLAVQAIGSHLVVAALPEGDSNCPVVLADSGYIKDSQEVRYVDGVPALTKHLTLMEPNSVTEEDLKSLLFIGNVVSLQAFYDAIQSARTSASKDSVIHGVVGNCATFILDVMTDLQLDFGKKEMQIEIINFVAQALMGSEDKDTMLANIKQKINSPAVKAWMKLRGDKYVVKKYVKTFLKNYKSD